MNGPVTTYNDPTKRPWAWSYSKLKNYETCPKRHFHYDISKDVKEPQSEELKDGFYVHEMLAKRVMNNEPLPERLQKYEPWAVKILTGEGKILVEQKLAFREDYSPCGYFEKGVWFRGVGDVIKIVGHAALIVDWKTGKIVEDSQQLMLMAQCVFSHYPEVLGVRSEFVWLNHDATTRQNFKRDEMAQHWVGMLPRVAALKQAELTMTYPPKPGFLCRKWCAVKSCPHWGE